MEVSDEPGNRSYTKMNTDCNLIWEAYMREDLDEPPDGPPRNLGGINPLQLPLHHPRAHIDDQFHQFLLDHGIHNPVEVEMNVHDRNVKFAHFIVKRKFLVDLYNEKTRTYSIPEHFWRHRTGKPTQWGKFLLRLGGRLPGSGPA